MVRSNAHRLPLSALFIAAVLLACSGKQVAPTEEGPAPALAEQKLELDQDVTTFRLLFSGTVAKEDRSLMNAVFVMKNASLEKEFLALCDKEKIIGVKGHRSVGGFRVSLYNALPLESVQVMTELMKVFAEKKG